ncbi:MAG: Na-translocating system protein MpsC family protein [Gemmataceae bacterium]
MKTNGELETEISQAVIRFNKEYMGRGPLSARTCLLDHTALVRLQGVPTAAEPTSVRVEERSRDLIKQVRIELTERGRPLSLPPRGESCRS